jgi:hypothetical protein
MAFANAAAFADPNSRQMASGVDLNSRHAITDARGNVLAYAQTGGLMSPSRHELRPGQKIFRFGGSRRTAQAVAAGGWWVKQTEFEKILAFANVHGLSIGMAMRCLCLVPPEWSDVGVLIRARVVRELLAWRGLGNSVVTPAKGGGVMVNLPHQNEIAARRCHQLFIPGLNAPGLAADSLAVENSYPLDAQAGVRGFLYL